MSFFGFIKKTAKFVRNTFNAVVGATVSTATAAVATGVAAVALPFFAIGVGIYAASSFKRRFNASFLSSAVIGILAGAGSVIAAGLAVAGGIIASPFLGLARGFRNGFKAALIPSIFYYTVYDRYRERNRAAYQQRFDAIQQRGQNRWAEAEQQPAWMVRALAEQQRLQAQQPRVIHAVPRPEGALGLAASPRALPSPRLAPAAIRPPLPANNSHALVNRALANVNLPNARAGLARYVNDPQVANDDLVEKLSKLNPIPDAGFSFLKSEEIKAIQDIEAKEHPAHNLLALYQQTIEQQNGCSISASNLDEIKHPLTVEFKQDGAWHHYNYEADDYLLYVRSRPSNALADLPENRFKLDGRALELGEGNGDLQGENVRIYKGLHPETIATLKREVTPLVQALRAHLPNPRPLSPRAVNAAYSPRAFNQRPEGASPRANEGNVVIDINNELSPRREGMRCQ